MSNTIFKTTYKSVNDYLPKAEKNDILVFVDSKKSEILKRLKKRKNFNLKIFKKFKDIQLSSNYKKKKSDFIIKNDFRKKSVKTGINNVLERII